MAGLQARHDDLLRQQAAAARSHHSENAELKSRLEHLQSQSESRQQDMMTLQARSDGWQEMSDLWKSQHARAKQEITYWKGQVNYWQVQSQKSTKGLVSVGVVAARTPVDWKPAGQPIVTQCCCAVETS